MTPRATYTAAEVAALAGVGTWSIFEAARRGGDTELGRLAIRVGRRIVWPKSKVDALLGLAESDSSRIDIGRERGGAPRPLLVSISGGGVSAGFAPPR